MSASMGSLFQELVVSRATLLALVVSRLAGFVVASPFPGENVGATQRVGLVCVLSWVVVLSTDASYVPTSIGYGLVAPASLEVACGAAIGLVFRLILSAADIVGSVLSQATGLSTPAVFSPTSESQETPAARAVTLFALVLAVALGTHRVVLAYLLASFRALPPGHALSVSNAAPLVFQLGGEALATGVRLSMPLVAVSLVSQLTLALIARAAPSLQIFSVGLSITVFAGGATFVASLDDLGGGLGSSFASLPDRLDRLLALMAAAGT